MAGHITVKFLMLGESGAGKSALLARYTTDTFSPHFITTVGIDFRVKTIELPDGLRVKVMIFDTSGQERYRSIASSYYRGAHGLILVYDVTSPESYFKLSEHWVPELRRYCPRNVDLVLLGNKADVENFREVDTEHGLALATQIGIPNSFFETSAKQNTNVNEAFEHITMKAVKRLIENADQYRRKHPVVDTDVPYAPPKSFCDWFCSFFPWSTESSTTSA